MSRLILIPVGILLLVGVALSGSFVFDAYLARPDADASARGFVVEPGDGASRVAWKLGEEGFVASPFFFSAYARLSGTERDFKPGTFELREGMSFSAIVEELTRADSEEVQITIPEGFTLKQIGERVRQALPHVTEDEWNAAVGASSDLASHPFIVAAGKPSDVDLEGYLFPDTYRFFADATAYDAARKMVDTMSASFELTDPTEQVPNAHALLTLASVVEREVRSPEDMKQVADIFLSRMEIGMPLQADSTISYYLGKTSAELTVNDLRADEPFNTYTRVGLPPGPIASPGMYAIDAVLHPVANPYLFFLTTADGTVIYAKTFEEHVANKGTHL